jgi:KUP system potassium uptake protein
MNDESTEHGHSESLSSLALGAIGVVFGDIGTSPLYALKESFIGHHPLAVDPAHVFGVLSLVFWTMMLIVTCKYVFVILRADNKGEGGSLALLALIARKLGDHRMGGVIAMLGVIATALFYGDAIITPAISVLSAVEGLTVVNEGFADWVLPLSIGILIGLFAIQSRGTAAVGKMFGPVMILYFGVLALLGGHQYRPRARGAVGAQPSLCLRLLPAGPGLGLPRAGLGRAGRDRRGGALR